MSVQYLNNDAKFGAEMAWLGAQTTDILVPDIQRTYIVMSPIRSYFNSWADPGCLEGGVNTSFLKTMYVSLSQTNIWRTGI